MRPASLGTMYPHPRAKGKQQDLPVEQHGVFSYRLLLFFAESETKISLPGLGIM